jgi:amidophosphoribosyltransferase
MVASESVAIDANGFRVLRDVGPGEAVFIDQHGRLHTQQCAPHASLNPCIFEYVYLARPDSIIDGASVYETRLNMGRKLAAQIKRSHRSLDIDVAIPIPDSGRPAALQLAAGLGVAYREGFVKNRYIGRTFIMPGQAVRSRSVRQKLNPMSMEFAGKNVMLVDDSIVRGTTSRKLVRMLRRNGAREIHFRVGCPPVTHPCFYGIDTPSRRELIGAVKTPEEIREFLGADSIGYLSMEGLLGCEADGTQFCHACFSGEYPIPIDPKAGKLDMERMHRLEGAGR